MYKSQQINIKHPCLNHIQLILFYLTSLNLILDSDFLNFLKCCMCDKPLEKSLFSLLHVYSTEGRTGNKDNDRMKKCF